MSDEIELIPGLKINETIEEPAKKDNEAPDVQKIDYSAIASEQRVELLAHLRKLKQELDNANTSVDALRGKFKANEAGSIDGISLLQVRNHCFLEYLENIAQFISAKTNGDDVAPAVESLVSNRCVLEKIKPLENQLKYQLQKYKEIEEHKSTSLRANPSSMLNEEDTKYNEEGERMVSSEYQAPQVMSSMYPGAHEDQVKEAKYARSIKAHSKQSVLMDEVAADIRDDAQEVGKKAAANRKMKEFMQKMKDIEELEEETMHRIPKSKKDRQMLKQLELSQNSLGSILDYDKIGGSKKNKKKK